MPSISSSTSDPARSGVVMNSNGSSGDGGRRRRSSGGSSGRLFASLHDQKRASLDASAAARRASFAEQMQPLGFFGGLWYSFTKGS